MELDIVIEIARNSAPNAGEPTDAQRALDFAIAVLMQLDHPDLDEAIGVLEEISHHNHAVTFSAE